MTALKPAKSLLGKLELPSSPDLFLLAVAAALAASKKIRFPQLKNTPLLQTWTEVFKGHCVFEWNDDSCVMSPVVENESSFLLIPYRLLPYRDLIVFAALGMGKVVSFRDVSQKRLQAWIEQARKFKIELEIVQYGENPGLNVKDAGDILLNPSLVDENDISAYLGFLMGRKQNASFQIDFPFSNPLRNLASIFGFDLTVKSTLVKESDSLAKRLKFFQSKKKQNRSSGQMFSVTVDFSGKNDSQLIDIALPGDEVLGSIMIAAKCILPKGSFVLSNMPLETWATPVLSFIRKMGGKLSVQETHRSSFGSTGLINIQKCDLVGRKIECSPAFAFKPHLPSMVILAAFAEGQSVFRDLEDLRNDEPDEIALIESCIRTLGARHGEMPDGIVMEGGRDFDGFDLNDSLSPSISGSFAVAGLRCIGATNINDDLLSQRWPDFFKILEQICEFRA